MSEEITELQYEPTAILHTVPLKCNLFIYTCEEQFITNMFSISVMHIGFMKN